MVPQSRVSYYYLSYESGHSGDFSDAMEARHSGLRAKGASFMNIRNHMLAALTANAIAKLPLCSSSVKPPLKPRQRGRSTMENPRQSATSNHWRQPNQKLNARLKGRECLSGDAFAQED